MLVFNGLLEKAQFQGHRAEKALTEHILSVPHLIKENCLALSLIESQESRKKIFFDAVPL